MPLFRAAIALTLVTLLYSAAGAQSTVTVTAQEDTYVNGGQAASSYGNSTDMVVHNYGPKIGLVRFELSPFAGQVITRARLRFRLNSLQTSGVIGVDVANSAWSENSVSFSTLPGVAAPAGTVTVTAADVGNSVDVDVTDAVRSWLSGAQPNYGFRLQTSTGIKAEIDTLNSAGTPMVLLLDTAPAGSTTTLSVVQDAYINGLQPTSNFGNAAELVVHNYGPKSGLAQFDVAALYGSNVTSAVLRFKLTQLKFDGTINLQPLNASWAESAVNAANQPPAVGTVLAIPVSTTDVGTTVEVDVTSLVNQWTSGSQPNHGFLLQTDDDLKAEIDSRNATSGQPMQLVISTDGTVFNEPPVIDPVDSQTVAAGSPLTFDVIATDPDGPPPRLEVSNLPGNATPAGFSVSGATGTFSWTPATGDVGVYPNVTFTATDADDPNLVTTLKLTITVTAGGASTTDTLRVTEDTFINGAQPGSNYADSRTIVVHNYGPKIGLVHFDLSSLAGTTVSSATLRLGLSNLRNPGVVKVQPITEPWSANAVSYTNQPAFGSTTATLPVQLTDIGSTVAVDITAIVQAWFDGSVPNYGLRLQTDDNIKADFVSLEGGSALELDVTMYTGNANRPPVLAPIDPLQVAEADTLQINLLATDLDNDALTLSLSGNPDFVELIDAGDGSAVLALTPGPNDAGVYDLQVAVTDDAFPVGVDTQTVRVTVTPTNLPPETIDLSNAATYDGAPADALVGTLSVSDPDNEDVHSLVLVDDAGGLFVLNGSQLRIGAVPLSTGGVTQTHPIRVTATDTGGQSLTQDFLISVNPNSAPALTIATPAEGQSVPADGFIVSGNALDDFGVTSVKASLMVWGVGVTVWEKPLDVAVQSGRWSFAVRPAQLAQDRAISIKLDVSDGAGLVSTEILNLSVVATDRSVRHHINRLTFGTTPTLEAEVAASGTAAFVQAQLNPAGIDDSTFDALIAGLPMNTLADLQRYQLLHALYSRRQLREVLTVFWDNHFNTSFHTHGSASYERDENDLFRANALGNFRTLLGISAGSPAMLFYLNGVSNIKADPNENYARELMELHTLSVDGGYTQADVDEVARVFTGWTVRNGVFVFDEARHDTEPKTVLGQSITAGGIDDGEAVLDLLAVHPSTAEFICEKLVSLFVADEPPTGLVQTCAATFLSASAAPDQMKQVVDLILSSPEFADPSRYHDKVQTPVEFAAGLIRQFDAAGTLSDVPPALARMGMPLFENHIPTGYSEVAPDWLASSQLIERIKFANDLAFNSVGGDALHLDPIAFFTAQGYETAEGIVAYLFELTHGDVPSDVEWAAALAVLTDNGTSTFDISAPDAEARLRRLIGTVLSFPAENYQ